MFFQVKIKREKRRQAGSHQPTAQTDCKGQALRVLEKISTLRVVFFPKTLTTLPHPPFQTLSLLFFSFFLLKKNIGNGILGNSRTPFKVNNDVSIRSGQNINGSLYENISFQLPPTVTDLFRTSFFYPEQSWALRNCALDDFTEKPDGLSQRKSYRSILPKLLCFHHE